MDDAKAGLESTPILFCLFSSEMLVLNEVSCARFNSKLFFDTFKLCAVCVRLSRTLAPLGFRFIVKFLFDEENASSSLL